MVRLLWLGVLAITVAGCRCGYDGEIPTLPEKIVGHCTYTNPFSKRQECRDYVGEWTDAKATQNCRDQGSTVELGSGCGIEERLGYCILDEKSATPIRITFPGSDASLCASSERGCEFFGGGIFDPSSVCGGATTPGGGTGLPTFQWPEKTCRAPKSGEPMGQGPEGQVCTWEAISGATEPGRHFDDYASCDRVRTQRPYYPVGANDGATKDDPRLMDPAYAMELAWVRQQVEATACVCCHSTRAPEGPSNWFVDQPTGNFANGFSTRGLAMAAGWIDTVGFGAYPTAENNGFSRAAPDRPHDSALVTTDPARMARFFEGELAHRGIGKEGLYGAPGGAGPLDEQRFYKPMPCGEGEGLSADGTLVWRLGGARYVYVLEADATSPGAPPNLDTPAGTRWRIDVPHTGQPVASGTVRFGVVPQGFVQKVPAQGAPPALESGRTYYLYALADVAQPNSRCLFTVP